MLICHGKNMTCIDFGLTMSKIKVISVLFVKKWFKLLLLRTIYHSAVIFYMLIGFDKDMTPIDFRFTRSKVMVTMVTCKSNVNMVSPQYFENCLRQSFHISHADWSWRGHDPN